MFHESREWKGASHGAECNREGQEVRLGRVFYLPSEYDFATHRAYRRRDATSMGVVEDRLADSRGSLGVDGLSCPAVFHRVSDIGLCQRDLLLTSIQGNQAYRRTYFVIGLPPLPSF